MERRLFVKLSAFTALALTLPFAESCSRGPKEMAVAQPFLFSHLVDSKTIKEVGANYLETHSAERDRKTLSQLLMGGKDVANFKQNEIQSMLKKQVTADFKAGNVIQVSGWVMALTEARQCALYTII
ncbi:tRNA G26 N,N-dimethylase Trm1 [Mucilaginibacter sp. UYNi724]